MYLPSDFDCGASSVDRCPSPSTTTVPGCCALSTIGFCRVPLCETEICSSYVPGNTSTVSPGDAIAIAALMELIGEASDPDPAALPDGLTKYVRPSCGCSTVTFTASDVVLCPPSSYATAVTR